MATPPIGTAAAAFGPRLRALRLRRGWTKRRVGDWIGCSPQAVTFWERGKRTPRADYLEALAEMFGCSMDELWLGRAA